MQLFYTSFIEHHCVHQYNSCKTTVFQLSSIIITEVTLSDYVTFSTAETQRASSMHQLRNK